MSFSSVPTATFAIAIIIVAIASGSFVFAGGVPNDTGQGPKEDTEHATESTDANASEAVGSGAESGSESETSQPIMGSLETSAREVAPGETITYTIDYRNTVDEPLEPTFSVILSDGLSFVSNESVFESEGGELVARPEVLEAGESEQISFQAKAAEDISTDLKVTMTIEYQNPNTDEQVRDEASVSVAAATPTSASVDSDEGTPAGFAGAGVAFFPNSLVEWLILFVVLVIIVLIIKQLYEMYQERRAHDKNKKITEGQRGAQQGSVADQNSYEQPAPRVVDPFQRASEPERPRYNEYNESFAAGSDARQPQTDAKESLVYGAGASEMYPPDQHSSAAEQGAWPYGSVQPYGAYPSVGNGQMPYAPGAPMPVMMPPFMPMYGFPPGPYGAYGYGFMPPQDAYGQPMPDQASGQPHYYAPQAVPFYGVPQPGQPPQAPPALGGPAAGQPFPPESSYGQQQEGSSSDENHGAPSGDQLPR